MTWDERISLDEVFIIDPFHIQASRNDAYFEARNRADKSSAHADGYAAEFGEDDPVGAAIRHREAFSVHRGLIKHAPTEQDRKHHVSQVQHHRSRISYFSGSNESKQSGPTIEESRAQLAPASNLNERVRRAASEKRSAPAAHYEDHDEHRTKEQLS